jgi:hypothetical protein
VGCQLPNKYGNTTISATFCCHSCKFLPAGCRLPYTPAGSYEYIHHE